MHVAQLGDSIFDNGPHVPGGEPDVLAHLRCLLPAQIQRLPGNVAQLVISVGGDNALSDPRPARSPRPFDRRGAEHFARRRKRFASGCEQAIDAALRLSLPTTVCTIYNGGHPLPRARLARGADDVQRRDPAHRLRAQPSRDRSGAGVHDA